MGKKVFRVDFAIQTALFQHFQRLFPNPGDQDHPSLLLEIGYEGGEMGLSGGIDQRDQAHAQQQDFGPVMDRAGECTFKPIGCSKKEGGPSIV